MVEEHHAKKTFFNQLFESDRLAAKEVRKEEHQAKREVKQASHMERKTEKQEKKVNRKAGAQACPADCQPETSLPAPAPAAKTVIRGQSSETLDSWPYPKTQTEIIQAYAQANQSAQAPSQTVQTPLKVIPQPEIKSKRQQFVFPKPPIPTNVDTSQNTPSHTKQVDAYCPPIGTTETGVFDPRQPFMSYTRLFDGSDAALVAHLRDYMEVSGDRRSGGWEAYLHRSEDFIRFTSHLMILEMLTLHGGQAKHQMIFKVRKYR